jgi:hypothetical protein
MDYQTNRTNLLPGNLPSIIVDGIYLIVLCVAFYFLYKIFTSFIKPTHKQF